MSSKLDSSPTPRPWGYFIVGSLCAVFIFVLGAVSTWAFVHPRADSASPDLTAPAEQGFSLYDEAWQIVETDFIGDLPDATTRTYGAIRGSVDTIDDPYTYFVEPEPAVREQENLQGHFGGIGAYLELGEDGRIHLDPMVDRPADIAGIERGDILVAVDDYTLPVPVDLEDATDRVRGPVDSFVRLTVLRGAEQLDFEITRKQIELPSVEWRKIEQAPGTGYIRIERFSSLTVRELEQAIDELRSIDVADKLILDLRGNPGGLLDAAVDVSSVFLDGGPVLIERRSDGSEEKYSATSGGAAITSPLVILVDSGTASASEIVAGALQDRGRAILVGHTTYGKGSVQRIHRLSDQSALHVTFARWFTPNGQVIDGQGLSPTISIPDNAEGEDPALQQALKQLQ
jgi:carboxyl-terminal processing protease